MEYEYDAKLEMYVKVKTEEEIALSEFNDLLNKLIENEKNLDDWELFSGLEDLFFYRYEIDVEELIEERLKAIPYSKIHKQFDELKKDMEKIKEKNKLIADDVINTFKKIGA